MASKKQGGIDIQHVSHSLIKVMDKYCSKEEADLLQRSIPNINFTTTLGLLWTAKEAMKKGVSKEGINLPGFLELELYEIATVNMQTFHATFKMRTVNEKKNIDVITKEKSKVKRTVEVIVSPLLHDGL